MTTTFQITGFWLLVILTAVVVAKVAAGWLLLRRARRAEEERRTLQVQLAQSQKMEAIGKLAGGVAHDFNNLLTAILGYASLILEDTPADSPVHDEALQIKRAAESAATLTQKLLAFSRRQILQSSRIEIGTLLADVVRLIERVIGEQVTLRLRAEPSLWPVMADPVQLEQTFLNLAINARDAMPRGGVLTIEARNAPRPQGERRPDHFVPPGEYVQIVVNDTGTGMDEGTRVRMFEPFFTTKGEGKGTGLGMSTVYGIVKQSGGFIHVTSTVGAGTTIDLLFPRAAMPATSGETSVGAVSETATPEPALTGTETILLVEDDPAVRDLACTTLERHGYRVLVAAAADEAIRIVIDHREPIALLLTDVVMPGMQGPDLAAALRIVSPGLRVLFMTGYAAGQVTDETLREAAVLLKPFSPPLLTHAVRRALDARPSGAVVPPTA